MFSLPRLILCCWLAFVTVVQGRQWQESSTDRHKSVANLRKALGKIGFQFQEAARFHHQEEIVQLPTSVDKGSKHTIVFAVQQRNLDSLPDILHDVSMPSSANYGKHWTREQIANLTSNPVGAAHVMTFLEEYGFEVTGVTQFQDYITASGTIGQWEVLFNTDFRVFHDTLHDRRFVRALEHSLPTSITPHVMGVFGASDYFLDYNDKPVKARSTWTKDLHLSIDMASPRSHRGTANEVASGANDYPTPDGDLWCDNLCNNVTTCTFCVAYPQLLFRVYNVPLPVSNVSVSQAIFASLDQSFSPYDWEDFQTHLNLTIQPIAGAYNGHVYYNACLYDTDNCDEASLDVQYITSMAQGVPTYFDYVAAPSTGSLFVDWILTVANMSDPADVFSISYGGMEAGQSPTTLTTFNTEAQKLGIAGVTIICASGDNGAVGSQVSQDPSICGYTPTFPSVSPFVTSVGATQVRFTGGTGRMPLAVSATVDPRVLLGVV
jgi:tripeptidyl-peptidase-1